jgi:DNA ligase 4
MIRKGKDYTYLYGKHVGVGRLTPYIDAAFDERVEESVYPYISEIMS